MLSYILGKQDKQEKKVEGDITGIFNSKLKNQFCQICEKNSATKAAFGKQFKPVFTCATCEINAVGGSVQRLGPKFLIPIEKFSQEATKQLINYQTSLKTPPVEHKKTGQTCEDLKSKVNELSHKINDQYKKMKTVAKNKHEELLKESTQQNTITIFEEVGKLNREKKLAELENGRSIIKKSIVNNKGLTFTDEEAIETVNNSINEKFNTVRKQAKIKLKPLEDLIDEINAMEF